VPVVIAPVAGRSTTSTAQIGVRDRFSTGIPPICKHARHTQDAVIEKDNKKTRVRRDHGPGYA